MTNCVTLTHEDAFANIKLLEELENLPKKQVYGFGVDGKRFKIIKMSDGFFTRIWFSILKFLKFIKADDKSIKQLKDYTIDHLKCNDYKEWAKTHYKVSKVGIKNLIEENEELRTKLREGKCHNTEVDKEKSELLADISSSKSTIKDLQLKLAQAQSQLATANADKEEQALAIIEQAKVIADKDEEKDKLTADLAAQKKRASRYRKRKTHYKEESSYYKEGWKKEHDGVDIKDYLKEHKLYEAIHDKFHKSHKKAEK